MAHIWVSILSGTDLSVLPTWFLYLVFSLISRLTLTYTNIGKSITILLISSIVV